MASLAGKVAIVTGASRGIGREVALSLMNEGATVFAVARKLQSLGLAIAKDGSRVIPWEADVRDEGSVARLFKEVATEFERLDVLVNSAGLGQGEAKSVLDTPPTFLDELYSTNLRGVYVCCQYALRLMLPRNSGLIVTMVSAAGIKGFKNQAAYCATKHGVLGLTKALSHEYRGSGIQFSAILPGRVNTDMLRQSTSGRVAAPVLQPADVAAAVLFLVCLSERVQVDQLTMRHPGEKPIW